jgi:hypothetical protein
MYGLTRRPHRRQDLVGRHDPAHVAVRQHRRRAGVGRGPVLDLARPATGQLGAGELLLDHGPVDGVVDVRGHVEVGGAEAPRALLRTIRRLRRMVQPRLHAPPAGRRRVDGVEARRQRARAGAVRRQVDPQRGRLDVGAVRAADRRAALRPQRPDAAAERGDLERLAEARRPLDAQLRPAHDPHAVVVDARIDDVGPCGVLEPAGDRVQARPPRRRDVGEPDRRRVVVDPPGGGRRDHHDGSRACGANVIAP